MSTGRVGGMVVDGTAVTLVTLVSDDERWQLESIDEWTHARVMKEKGPLTVHRGLPIILDAMDWLEHASGLRAADWDVRPPLWRNGKARNPTQQELRDNFRALKLRNCGEPVDICEKYAFWFAAWGATRTTPTAEAAEAERLLLAMVKAAPAGVPGSPFSRAFVASHGYLVERGLLRREEP